jgi:predicted RNA-binding Zn-ribbon protein involved in translation (DUF1610 family)
MGSDFLGWREVYQVNHYGGKDKEYRCGYCGNYVAGRTGIAGKSGVVLICPNCSYPTFIRSDGDQFPGPPHGKDVDNLPKDVNKLYREARECIRHSLHNASVLTARKILMHVAVDKGADEDSSFQQFVEYLDDANYLPPGGEGWVDVIRQKGNEANHEIPSMTKQDAEELVKFLEMLLRIVYEMPGSLPKKAG